MSLDSVFPAFRRVVGRWRLKASLELTGLSHRGHGSPRCPGAKEARREQCLTRKIPYRFDGSLEDIFDLQDKVAINVAGVIEPTLQAAEVRRSTARPATDLTAYDLYLRALATFYPITREGLLKALEFESTGTSHRSALRSGAVLSGDVPMRLVRESWAEEPEDASRKGIDLSRRALQVAGDDPSILASSARKRSGIAATCRIRSPRCLVDCDLPIAEPMVRRLAAGGRMDSNHWYRGTKAVDLRTIPGIAGDRRGS